MAPEKSPEAFRTISEAADWLGTPAHVLRFWESRFPEIAPVKRAGGRRYYRPDDLLLIGGIKRLLHDEGNTIKSVQARLKSEGASAIAALSPPLELDGPTETEESEAAAGTGGETSEVEPAAEGAKDVVAEPTLPPAATTPGEDIAASTKKDRPDRLPLGDSPQEAPAFRRAATPPTQDAPPEQVASAAADAPDDEPESPPPPRQGFFFDDAVAVDEDFEAVEQTPDEAILIPEDLARDLPPLPDLPPDPEDGTPMNGTELPLASELRATEMVSTSEVTDLAARLRAVRDRLG